MKECYLNGDYVDLADAKVSVLDRGFIFGEGIYEVIGVHSRKPFALSLHLERLDLNLSEMGLSNPLSSEAWSSLISNLISRNGCVFGSIYIQITSGKPPRNRECFCCSGTHGNHEHLASVCLHFNNPAVP